MFVILTGRPGVYRTDPGAGMRICETYEYLFCGRPRARYVIATLPEDVKIRVIDEGPPERVSHVPSKFLEKFATVDAARERLRSLVGFGELDTSLRKLA